MKEVVLDTETTGLSVKEGHRLVEIGCLEIDNLIPLIKISLLNPEKSFESALKVHGYTDDFYPTKRNLVKLSMNFLIL